MHIREDRGEKNSFPIFCRRKAQSFSLVSQNFLGQLWKDDDDEVAEKS